MLVVINVCSKLHWTTEETFCDCLVNTLETLEDHIIIRGTPIKPPGDHPIITWGAPGTTW